MLNEQASHLVMTMPKDTHGRKQSLWHLLVKFLCSSIGLVIVVTGYAVGGAFLFILLEEHIALQNCQQASCKC